VLLLTVHAALAAPEAGAPRLEDPPWVTDPAERERIEQAIPRQAIVPPRRPRRLLIFDLNVGYGGHPSIAYANHAFALIGEKTGAFSTVVSRDPTIFRAEHLRQFDAVFLNNTVGNLFTDPELRQSLVEFVYGGGGLMGVHGSSVAFTEWPGAREDWPEFGLMIGARGANHKDSTEHVFIRLDDPDHPLNRVFGGHGFDYRDEFFRVHEPYSRHRVRVLLAIDTEKTDVNAGQPRGDTYRADNDYALAWVRNYGRGRTFYCTIAHNPYVFWDANMLQFYLAAIQFALGDLAAPTTPSGRLTPAVSAQERLGWRLGLEPDGFAQGTLFETVDAAASLGLAYVGASQTQRVSAGIARNFDEPLSAEDLRAIRLKLDAAGVRLLTYSISRLPRDESGCRRLFEFGRKMGVETLIAEPSPESLHTLEGFCDEFDLNLAIRSGTVKGKSASRTSPLSEVAKLCQGRSSRMGACGNVGDWLRSGIDPVKGIRTLKERLLTLQLHDVNQRAPEAHEVPWGSGAGKTAPVLQEIRRLGLKPTMVSLQPASGASRTASEAARSIDFFNRTTLEMRP
jgi:hypothetical protein